MKVIFRRPDLSCDWVHILDSFKKYSFREAVVLEIGASKIERTRELSKLCRELIGIELIPEAIPANFDNVRYEVCDWQVLTSKVMPGSVDIAVATHVLEHVQDDLLAINELYRVLKPGGIALLNTPNRKRLVRAIMGGISGEPTFPRQIVRTRDMRRWVLENVGADLSDDGDLGDIKYVVEHQREYSKQDLDHLLEASLFSKYEVSPVGLGLHAGSLDMYLDSMPSRLGKYALSWEVHLFRE